MKPIRRAIVGAGVAIGYAAIALLAGRYDTQILPIAIATFLATVFVLTPRSEIELSTPELGVLDRVLQKRILDGVLVLGLSVILLAQVV